MLDIEHRQPVARLVAVPVYKCHSNGTDAAYYSTVTIHKFHSDGTDAAHYSTITIDAVTQS